VIWKSGLNYSGNWAIFEFSAGLPQFIQGTDMSKQHPECPLYNHSTCRELHNPKLCAIIREDQTCLKKQQKSKKDESDTHHNPPN
jgi:hypothetical protein